MHWATRAIVMCAGLGCAHRAACWSPQPGTTHNPAAAAAVLCTLTLSLSLSLTLSSLCDAASVHAMLSRSRHNKLPRALAARSNA